VDFAKNPEPAKRLQSDWDNRSTLCYGANEALRQQVRDPKFGDTLSGDVDWDVGFPRVDV